VTVAAQRELSIAIDGMSCDGCVASMKKVLSRLPGVQVDGVAVGSARVLLDEAKATPPDVVRAIEKAGYGARIAES
jgi:copper chaperone